MANRTDQRLIVGGTPRAELLPPELKLEEKARAQRRRLVAVVFLVIIVTAGIYAYSALVAETSRQRLATANNYSSELLAEQAKYIEARQLAAQVTASKDARTVGMAQEIDWYENYLETSLSVSSVGATLGTYEVKASTPLTPASAPTSALEKPSVARVSITATTLDYPSVGAWLDALKKVTGFAGATINSISLEGGGYTVTCVLLIDEGAYTNRFNPDAEDADATTEEDGQ